MLTAWPTQGRAQALADAVLAAHLLPTRGMPRKVPQIPALPHAASEGAPLRVLEVVAPRRGGPGAAEVVEVRVTVWRFLFDAARGTATVRPLLSEAVSRSRSQ